jgi:hypothetical protein
MLSFEIDKSNTESLKSLRKYYQDIIENPQQTKEQKANAKKCIEKINLEIGD